MGSEDGDGAEAEASAGEAAAKAAWLEAKRLFDLVRKARFAEPILAPLRASLHEARRRWDGFRPWPARLQTAESRVRSFRENLAKAEASLAAAEAAARLLEGTVENAREQLEAATTEFDDLQGEFWKLEEDARYEEEAAAAAERQFLAEQAAAAAALGPAVTPGAAAAAATPSPGGPLPAPRPLHRGRGHRPLPQFGGFYPGSHSACGGSGVSGRLCTKV